MSREYLEATERELESWPGVTMDHALAGKHRVINLYFHHKTRKVFTSASPSDGAHGLQNHISVVRRELASLGAARVKPAASPHRSRERNKPVREPMMIQGPAELPDNPFEVLRANLKEKPMTREVNINGKVAVLETGKTPPPRNFGRPKSDFRLLMEAMKPGESVFLPMTGKEVAAYNLSNIGKVLGLHFASRTEGEGTRVFCTEVKPAKSNGAAARPVVQVPRAAQQRPSW